MLEIFNPSRPSETGGRFHDRRDAGRILAAQLQQYSGEPTGIVLALPRGGVPVGFEVARALRLPLDIFIVRKLGVPGHEELAMGAIASGGVRILNERVIAGTFGLRETLDRVTEREQKELERREAEYRQGKTLPALRDRTVIVVDDGLATGASMRAAVAALKQHQAGRCIVAVPVSSPDTCFTLAQEVDEMVCALTPPDFMAVGQFYEDFSETTDAEVRELLAGAESSN